MLFIKILSIVLSLKTKSYFPKSIFYIYGPHRSASVWIFMKSVVFPLNLHVPICKFLFWLLTKNRIFWMVSIVCVGLLARRRDGGVIAYLWMPLITAYGWGWIAETINFRPVSSLLTTGKSSFTLGTITRAISDPLYDDFCRCFGDF